MNEYVDIANPADMASVLPTKSNIMQEVDSYLFERMHIVRPNGAIPSGNRYHYIGLFRDDKKRYVDDFFRKNREFFSETFTIPTSYGNIKTRLIRKQYGSKQVIERNKEKFLATTLLVDFEFNFRPEPDC